MPMCSICPFGDIFKASVPGTFSWFMSSTENIHANFSYCIKTLNKINFLSCIVSLVEILQFLFVLEAFPFLLKGKKN